MLYKIGDLVADYDLRLIKEKQLKDSEPADFETVYTFGLIIDVNPIDPEDRYFQLYRDSFFDNVSYTIMWADYEYPIEKYSAGHIKQFRDNLLQIEKEIDEKDRTK